MKKLLLGGVVAVSLGLGVFMAPTPSTNIGADTVNAQVPCDGYWYHPHFRFLYYVQEEDGSFTPYYVFWYWHVHSDAECWA